MNAQRTIDLIANLVILLETNANLSKHPAAVEARKYINDSAIKPFMPVLPVLVPAPGSMDEIWSSFDEQLKPTTTHSAAEYADYHHARLALDSNLAAKAAQFKAGIGAQS